MFMKKPSGFTLVEVLISIFVGLLIIAVIYAAVVTAQRSTANIERRVVAGQDTRAALELMTIEIQMASYNPTNAPASDNMWMNPGSCTAASVNQNYRGIQAATGTSISVEADINENGVIGGAGNANEIITYNYDIGNQYITRSTNCGGAQPFLGDTIASGRPRSVQVINTAAVPVFRYFNAQGAEIVAAGLPAGIPDIARIDVTLWVETADFDPGQTRRLVYSTSVIPRNHVIR
jgi:prepilin-type N-terminal cleavage/methylation domain-containing protein